MNDSSTGGYLAATSVAPAEDDALDAILQGLVVGITGLDGTLVRPRWQTIAPAMPEPAVNWCAIGVVGESPMAGANSFSVHIADGDGSSLYQVNDDIEILASFYGAAARANGVLLRDGLMVPQNRESLYAVEMMLCRMPDRGVFVPETVSLQTLRRFDVGFSLRRAVSRSWPVKNLLEANGTIVADDGASSPFDTNNAPTIGRVNP